jgi:hypothetical protein
MATVPSTQTETLDSRNEETCSGTVQEHNLGYMRSLFVLDSPIHVLLDSFPVTWLDKTVALSPAVADILVLCGPYVIH